MTDTDVETTPFIYIHTSVGRTQRRTFRDVARIGDRMQLHIGII
jgi:hypothetical protein